MKNKLTRYGIALTQDDVKVLRGIKQYLIRRDGPPVTLVTVIRYALRVALRTIEELGK